MGKSIIFILVSMVFSTVLFAQNPNEKPVWNVTLAANKTAPSNITVRNRCKGTHEFEIRPVNVPFLTISQLQLKVKGGKDKNVPVRFNTAGLSAKTYKGKVLVICKTCRRKPNCEQDRETLPVILTVPGSTKTVIDQNNTNPDKTATDAKHATEKKKDPYEGFKFKVVVTGAGDNGKTVSGSFTEASGLDLEVDPIDYRNGSSDITPRKIPGMKKFANITLKRSFVTDIGFLNWVIKGTKETAGQRQTSIFLLDENRKEVMRWNFKSGWPCKWTGPGLNAANNEVAIETLEICTEGLAIDGQK